MKNKRTKISVLCLVIIGIISISSYIIYTNYTKNLESEKEELSNGIAIYINDGNGNYVESYNNSFIYTNYEINESKSACYNSKGQKVYGVIDVDSNGSLVITTTVKVYCDIYFDEK